MYSDQRSTRPLPRSGRRRRRRVPLFRTILVLVAILALFRLGGSLFSPTVTPFSEEILGGEDLTAQLKELAREEPEAKPLLENQADYPQALLELVLRNRETLDFVLRYPEEKDRDPADHVGDVTQGTFPLLLQWDGRWGYAQYGDGLMAFTGCGPTVLSMAVCGLTGDDSVTPYAVAAYAHQAGYYVDGTGTSWDLMSAGCRRFGLEARELPLSRSSIVNALSQGQPVICSVGPGDFTTSGHFILLTGVEDGAFRVNDPNSRINSEQLWDYDSLAPQIRNLWAYSLAV